MAIRMQKVMARPSQASSAVSEQAPRLCGKAYGGCPSEAETNCLNFLGKQNLQSDIRFR